MIILPLLNMKNRFIRANQEDLSCEGVVMRYDEDVAGFPKHIVSVR